VVAAYHHSFCPSPDFRTPPLGFFFGFKSFTLTGGAFFAALVFFGIMISPDGIGA